MITSPQNLSEVIQNSTGEVDLLLRRNGEEVTVSLQAVAGLVEENQEAKALGIGTALIGTVSYPPHIALWKAFTKTGQYLSFIVVSLVGLIGSAFTLSADFSNIAGPVGIASLTGEAASIGLGALLTFSAFLSINLAVINLLPFPALDGGRLLFLGIEAVSRKKIPLKISQA